VADNGSSSRLARARDAKITVTSVAEELVREKADALLQGKGNRDIFTLLGMLPLCCSLLRSLVDYFVVKANMDANAKQKMSDEELLAQMRWVFIDNALFIQDHERGVQYDSNGRPRNFHEYYVLDITGACAEPQSSVQATK